MVASRRPALGLPNTGTFGANARYVLRSVDDAGKAQYGLQEVQAGSHRGSKSYHDWMAPPPGLQKERGFDTHGGNWVGRIWLGEMVGAFSQWSAGSKVARCQDSVGFGWVPQG